MKHNIRSYPSKQKAIDHAVYLNFQHRHKEDRFGVIRDTEGDFQIVPANHPEIQKRAYLRLPDSYAFMDYTHLCEIAQDGDPLSFWEAIRGMVSTLDGDVLRYLLHMKIPLEKFIRYELASRGYNDTYQWVGYENATLLWLIE